MSSPPDTPETLTEEELRHLAWVVEARRMCGDPDCRHETCSIRAEGNAVAKLLRIHDEQRKQLAELELKLMDSYQENRELRRENTRLIMEHVL